MLSNYEIGEINAKLEATGKTPREMRKIMAKAVIIKVNGSKSVAEFEVGDSYNLLSTTVGGLIECVTLRDKNFADMWINENGKFSNLEVNPIATALWFDMYGNTDYICGDVIITGGADDEGETLGLLDEEVAYFLNYGNFLFDLDSVLSEEVN